MTHGELLVLWENLGAPFTLLRDPAELGYMVVKLYGDIDLKGESESIAKWWALNPKKRKSYRGLKKFINTWYYHAASRHRNK